MGNVADLFFGDLRVDRERYDLVHDLIRQGELTPSRAASSKGWLSVARQRVVDAGADAATWLVDGVITRSLDATVTDDEAYTVSWTVVSEPNVGAAVIETATAEDTSITLAALGQYVLQLEAFDGEYTGSDTVTINVYNDGCEAAQSLPDYMPSPGDINGDCIFDQLDLDILNEDWLKDDSLTEP